MVLAYFDEVPPTDPSEIDVSRRSTTAAVEFGQVGGNREWGQKVRRDRVLWLRF